MRKPLMLLSLPNSGSTWFARCLADHHDGRYFCEYFNPLRNPAREETLVQNFGCETVASYHKIAAVGGPEIHDQIDAMWRRDGYTFTKEVFSPFKLPVFVRHFRCVVLLRDEELTFPPSRLRVISFYEHAWWALFERSVYALGARGATARAREAFRVLQARVRADAKVCHVPIIEYRDLFGTEAEVRALLAPFADHVDIAGAAAQIVATRKMPDREQVSS